MIRRMFKKKSKKDRNGIIITNAVKIECNISSGSKYLLRSAHESNGFEQSIRKSKILEASIILKVKAIIKMIASTNHRKKYI